MKGLPSPQFSSRALVRTGVAMIPLAVAMFAAPAFAQDATATAPQESTQAGTGSQTAGTAVGTDNTPDVVVTGTLFRNQSKTNIASPVTSITADDLNARGVNTVQEALQTLASNNGAALTNSFTANGAFAGGASGISLRGLTTNSTLVVFDGLRAAYYPLADDGVRNFVDLNTIPDEIVDRVEVLRDGASSSYGADAIAGVVNIITKKQITGIAGNVEAGISEHGDAANQRVSLTAGYGDLAEKGFNVYVSGHYINQDPLFSRDRKYPYSSSNQSGVCYNGQCGADNTANSPTNFNGVSTLPPVYLVRPYDATNTTAVAGSRYQFLNPTTGCGNLTSYTLSDAQYQANVTSPRTVCVQDTLNQGGVIEPSLKRIGASARATVNIGDRTHAYVEFNFEQSTVGYSGYGLASPAVPTNSVLRGNGQPGILYPAFSTANFGGGAYAVGSAPLALPIYVCPRGTTVACTAANGTLNPNNPFAAQGQVARLIGTAPDISQYTSTRSRAYRLAAAVDGSFGDGWNWQVDGLGMRTNLLRQFEGQIYIQHLLDVIADGSYNFLNPSANSQTVRNYLSPTLNANANSEEYQADASLSKSFFDLPGGPLQVGVGGSYRFESIYAPSANPDNNGPTQRYLGINAFGTVGHRSVESGFFEIQAPILTQLQLEGSGRYDHYSSGQSHFSPKGGVVFNPIRQVTLRGTISGGFRIPSFAEASSLPTTGFVPYFTQLPAAFLAQYTTPGSAGVCAVRTSQYCSSYVTGYSVGEQTSANPNLKPETSRNITAGIELRPTRWLTLTADYYNIKKNNAIASTPFSPALAAYYSGGSVPAGYSVLLNAPDVNHPNATPTVSVVGAPFINANTIKTSGIDIGAKANFHFANGWSFSSNGEAEYINNLDTYFPDGHVERYAGTLGNYNLTAGTGTPRWKATWQNTLDVGVASISGTAYYTAGYNLSADDQNSGYCTTPQGDNAGLDGGLQPCNVKHFIDFDLTGTVNVGKRFTLYVNVLNVFDAKPPLDTVTYGGYLYNPVVAEQGIVGRAFRAGVRVKL